MGGTPKKAARGPAQLLPPVEALSVRVLGRLLHHQDPRLRKLAEEERSRRANLRRGLARFDHLVAAWSLRCSPALAQAEAELAAADLSEAAKKMGKIRVLSVADLLARGIRSIHEETSISELFI